MSSGIFFGMNEEQLAQNLTKIFQAGSWVLNQIKRLQKAIVVFLFFFGTEGVHASWCNARYTNMNIV